MLDRWLGGTLRAQSFCPSLSILCLSRSISLCIGPLFSAMEVLSWLIHICCWASWHIFWQRQAKLTITKKKNQNEQETVWFLVLWMICVLFSGGVQTNCCNFSSRCALIIPKWVSSLITRCEPEMQLNLQLSRCPVMTLLELVVRWLR